MTAERTWRKSTYSGDTASGSCVEVSLDRSWQKSSYSGSTDSGTCIEVLLDQAALVRDSKGSGGAVLAFSLSAWRAFVAQARV
ncbi:DUF397 domain-containing protein [Lentzea sp. NPDC092896]|uniref:DUF397 domain-containing protein n=1 Tax=Lentzea sp. NPDC092896 TaxID=3364127 RepID=UPI003828B1D4